MGCCISMCCLLSLLSIAGLAYYFDKKIKELETTAGGVPFNPAPLLNDIADLKNRVTTLEGDVIGLDTGIANLEDELIALVQSLPPLSTLPVVTATFAMAAGQTGIFGFNGNPAVGAGPKPIFTDPSSFSTASLTAPIVRNSTITSGSSDITLNSNIDLGNFIVNVAGTYSILARFKISNVGPAQSLPSVIFNLLNGSGVNIGSVTASIPVTTAGAESQEVSISLTNIVISAGGTFRIMTLANDISSTSNLGLSVGNIRFDLTSL